MQCSVKKQLKGKGDERWLRRLHSVVCWVCFAFFYVSKKPRFGLSSLCVKCHLTFSGQGFEERAFSQRINLSETLGKHFTEHWKGSLFSIPVRCRMRYYLIWRHQIFRWRERIILDTALSPIYGVNKQSTIPRVYWVEIILHSNMTLVVVI